MLITNLSVENFKSFGERQDAPLADITLVYGPNSAGKSTIIQSLLLLKQTMDGAKEHRASLVARGAFVDLGSFSALVHHHDIERPVIIGVTGLFDPEQEQSQPVLVAERNKARAEFTFMWDETLRSATHRSTVIEMESERFVFERVTEPIFDVTTKEDMRDRYGAFHLTIEGSALSRYFVSEDLLPGHEIVRISKTYWEDYPQKEFGEPEDLDDAAWNTFVADEEERIDFVWTRFQEERKRYQHTLDNLAWLLWPNSQPLMYLGRPWEFRDNFKSIVHVGPVRSVPERFHILGNDHAGMVCRNGENVIDAIVYAGSEDLHISGGEIVPTPKVNLRNEFMGTVNSWLETLGIPYDIEIQPLRADFVGDAVALTLVHRQSKVRVSMADVGYGVSQVLPIIVQCCLSRRSILCIEQPELHIHPRLQADIADLLIDCVGLSEGLKFNRVFRNAVPAADDVTDRTTEILTGDERTDETTIKDGWNDIPAFSRGRNVVTGLEDVYNQVIVETHSEHLLLRLQRRIREGRIRNTHVSVLYVDPLPDGSSTIRTIRLDEDGSMIDEWPGGFFEERYNEMFGR